MATKTAKNTLKFYNLLLEYSLKFVLYGIGSGFQKRENVRNLKKKAPEFWCEVKDFNEDFNYSVETYESVLYIKRINFFHPFQNICHFIKKKRLIKMDFL